MDHETLKNMVTHLAKYSRNSAIEGPKGIDNGLVSSKEFAFPFAQTEDAQAIIPMTWNAFLENLLRRSQHCGGDMVNMEKPLTYAWWRENNDRKVLAPLALRQNADNIIAGSLDMYRKRKVDFTDNQSPAEKRTKLDDGDATLLKTCSVVVEKASVKTMPLQYRCFSRKSFVKLFDILKELPQKKEKLKPVSQTEFMRTLNLQHKIASNDQRQGNGSVAYTVKLVTHPHIPFSSDYGRQLLKRERHCLSQDVVLRKLERTEWYLKGNPMRKNHVPQPQVTCHKKPATHMHHYKFPKRQFHQKRRSLQESFIRYICKPFSIKIEMMDLDDTKKVSAVDSAEENLSENTFSTQNNSLIVGMEEASSKKELIENDDACDDRKDSYMDDQQHVRNNRRSVRLNNIKKDLE